MINMRCKKNCACEECEHFGGQEVMRLKTKACPHCLISFITEQ